MIEVIEAGSVKSFSARTKQSNVNIHNYGPGTVFVGLNSNDPKGPSAIEVVADSGIYVEDRVVAVTVFSPGRNKIQFSQGTQIKAQPTNNENNQGTIKKNSRMVVLHVNTADKAMATTAGSTYTSLTRSFTAADKIKFYLDSANDGEFTAYVSYDGINFKATTVTAVTASTNSAGALAARKVFELEVPGPVAKAYYTFKDTGTAAGSIYGGIVIQESVVV